MGRGADKIVVMDNGLVAEEGTHEALESFFFCRVMAWQELLKQDQIYAGLVKRRTWAA